MRADGSGVQTYARELLRALPDAWPAARFVARVASDAPSFDARIVREPVIAGTNGGLRRKLLSALRATDADLVHGFDTDQSLRGDTPTIATVHDLALFDVPWAFSRLTGASKRAIAAASIRRADALIAVSSFTAERILAIFGRDSTVIHEAAGPHFRPATEAEISDVRHRYQLPARFVLYVGNHEPRKDLASLGEACRLAGVDLVVAGGAIVSTALPVNSIVIGYVPDADLAAIYGAADVVGYVARYEGFGLPPIEAMASGGCVMATRIGALTEVAAEGIEFVPQGEPEGQRDAIVELLQDPERAAHRRRYAIDEASKLSWTRAAAETVAVYKHAL